MNNGSAAQLPPGGVTVVRIFPSAVHNTDSRIVGAQWGDEGKGKLVDVLCEDVDIVARCQVPFNQPTKSGSNCQGGNNAGHTIVVGDSKYNFHIVSSGNFHT